MIEEALVTPITKAAPRDAFPTAKFLVSKFPYLDINYQKAEETRTAVTWLGVSEVNKIPLIIRLSHKQRRTHIRLDRFHPKKASEYWLIDESLRNQVVYSHPTQQLESSVLVAPEIPSVNLDPRLGSFRSRLNFRNCDSPNLRWPPQKISDLPFYSLASLDTNGSATFGWNIADVTSVTDNLRLAIEKARSLPIEDDGFLAPLG